MLSYPSFIKHSFFHTYFLSVIIFLLNMTNSSSVTINERCVIMTIYMCTNLFLPPLCLPSISPQLVPSPTPSIWLKLPCCIINVTNIAVKRLICNTLQPTSYHNFTLRTDMEVAATAWRYEQALSFPSKGEERTWLSAFIWNRKLPWFFKLLLFLE